VSDNVAECHICQSWNPWHHPFTRCASWCPNYENESIEAREKNEAFQAIGGYYGNHPLRATMLEGNLYRF
jgi:hypothetical protein